MMIKKASVILLNVGWHQITFNFSAIYNSFIISEPSTKNIKFVLKYRLYNLDVLIGKEESGIISV